MSAFSISTLQQVIQDLRVHPENPQIRQIYCDHLAWVHSQVFEKMSPLFSQDFYWLAVHYPKRVGLGQDLKLADRVLKAEQTFQSNVLEKNTTEGFSLFMKHYGAFAEHIGKKARDHQKDLPFHFALSHPQLIAWYQNVVYELGKNDAFRESFQESDPEAFSLILQRGILELIESDVKINPMPVLLTEAHWQSLLQMREEYSMLSEKDQKALLESPNENGSLRDRIKNLGETIAFSKRQPVNSLMHTLALLTAEEE